MEEGSSSLANDLVAGHSVTGLSCQLGQFCQRDPGTKEDSKVSDLVARSARSFEECV